MKFDSKRY